MTAVLEHSDLTALTDDALADMLADGDNAARLELARRDQADRMAKARGALTVIRAEAECAVHAQFLAASEVCRGRLLSREGMASGIRERDLWRIPRDRAQRFASEELNDYWFFSSPRITVAAYVRERAAERRAEYIQELDRNGGNDHDRLAGNEPGSLRHIPTASEAPQASAGGTVQRGGHRTIGAEDSTEAGAGDGGAGGTVPPVAREDGDDMGGDESGHEPGDLKFILDETAGFIGKYVAASSAQVDALTLYAAATWVITAFPTLGRLLISGETEASGKTVALTVTAALSANPLDASGTSYALQSALAGASNAPDQLTPTLYYDEISGIFGRSGLAATRDPLAEILRKGYKKGATRAWSVNRTAETYNIYTPFIMAGLRNAVPRDIRTRCISVVMRSGTPREYFDAREAEADAGALAASLGQAVTSRSAEIAAFRARGIHPRLRDRYLEVWEPLFAVAYILGGQEWLNRCLAAFRELALADAGQVVLSPRQQILRDAAQLLDGPLGDMAHLGFIGGLALADEMRRLDNPLYASRSEAGMAKLISEAMPVPTTQKRVDGRPVRGYFAHEISEAWEQVRPAEMEDAAILEEDNPFAVTGDTGDWDEWPASTGVTGDTAVFAEVSR